MNKADTSPEEWAEHDNIFLGSVEVTYGPCPAVRDMHRAASFTMFLNWAVAQLPLFEKPDDFAALLQMVDATLSKHPIRILSFTLMPKSLAFCALAGHNKSFRKKRLSLSIWLPFIRR